MVEWRSTKRLSDLGKFLFGLPLLLTSLAVAGCGNPSSPNAADDDETFLSLVETLGGADTVGYARAMEVRDFHFPEDHGPHEDFRTEWWYVTGNLDAEDGRELGFQFTIFRSSLAPKAPGGPSLWSTNQAYMGHFALTDITNENFRAAEIFSRGGAGLAGAIAEPFEVWLEDWRLEGVSDDAVFPMHLVADADGLSLDLIMESGKPYVLQGDAGLSQKGSEPGNASYYYAHTRMPTQGRVTIDGESLGVSGLAWLDREWSTSALSDGQVGWDWFALQLSDGWELMVYQLRREDGSPDPLSEGVLISPEGQRVPLEWGRGILVEPTQTWFSPVDDAEYPSGWRIQVPERGWDLTVTPALLDQELRVAFRYWEGSVRVDGRGQDDQEVYGRGYVELTGYAGPGLQQGVK
ncbi:hypothetical protein OAJ07_00800 [Gemmatimonadales bacterium]|nr:hypothetical protein [Gemmatimonadales bacterium]